MTELSSDELPEVASYLSRCSDSLVDDLRRLVRQPSVSATGDGIGDCAELLARMMNEVGVSSRVLPTAGHPIVFGEVRSSTTAKTLLVHTHYDVQPPEPLDEWTHPPYSAHVANGIMYGRGTTDAKGNVIAALKAVEAFLRSNEDLPVNLKFLFDGEEEIGSPSLPGFFKKHAQLFSDVDAVITFDAGFDATNRPTLWLGSCGILFVQLTAFGPTKDLHSSRSRLVGNPVWDLVWALNSIKTSSERIQIKGFYDDVRERTPAERQLLADFPWDLQAMKRELGVKRLLGGLDGVEALEKLLFESTCNVCGFSAGYAGEGPMSVLPRSATAKLEFRLVANQQPNDIFEKLKVHLADQGFDNVQAEMLGGCEPSQCPVDSDIARVVAEAAAKVYGLEPATKACNEASGRLATWTASQLGVGGAMTGIGPPNWRGHAPNEFMTLSHYLKGILYIATIYKRFGET